MQVHEALLVEGTSRFEILCYGIFQARDFDVLLREASIDKRQIDSAQHVFFERSWSNCVLLIEVSTENSQDIQSLIASSLSNMFLSGSCLAALCMYDGAFGGIDEIFSPSLAGQTYAFCFSAGNPVINLDADVLSSSEWTSVVDRCRNRLEKMTINS
jgi:hypothetical protein